MATRAELLESIEGMVADYRTGEIDRPSKDHISQWVDQFGRDIQERLLAEIAHVLQQTYIPRAKFDAFLAVLVKNQKLTQGDPASFWRTAKLLDIQKRGRSQREMLSMFSSPLEKELGLKLSDCGATPSCYVYLDDGLFTGNTILNELSGWLASDAPVEAVVHVIVMALHRGGQFYARTRLDKVAQEHGKKITFNWWRIVELEDRRTCTDTSDVLRPTHVPDDPNTQAYVKALRFAPVLRKPGSVGELNLFSSEENRDLLEQELLIKGAHIRSVCPRLPKYDRPLGNMVLEALGFGSTIVTFRNCPNNAPLAFWAGDPWHPLFRRKTN
jgi:hypothetical protein